ncbi:MAG: hypothetical protein R3E13_11955 [Alphaproteobacteria bacterium]
MKHDVSQYQDMRGQRIEQLEKQRQEQSRTRPDPRQFGPDWTH